MAFLASAAGVAPWFCLRPGKEGNTANAEEASRHVSVASWMREGREMILMADGRQCRVPEDSSGRVDMGQLRRMAGVRSNRALIAQGSNGENTVLPASGRVCLDDYTRLLNSPRAKRGNG